MVRNYRRKSDRGSYGSNSMMLALNSVNEGTSLIKVSRQYGIPARTLRRHRDKKVSAPGTITLGRFKQVLPPEVETELKNHIIDMERRMFGLSTKDLRRFAFDIAEKSGLHNPFNRESAMAGTELSSFLNRNNLSVRQPQATSIARVVGFNKPKTDQFFRLLKSVLNQHNYPATKVWNVDETALTTVQKPTKILTEKGARQVGKVTSAERGELVTFFCAMNAAGGYIPPMYVFPRKRMVDGLMMGAPPGAVGYVTESGWSDAEQFIKWLNHFANITNASKESKQVIILDGHHSHKTLAAVEFCRDHGIELLTLPPHSTHKMQPLDRCYFKSLKSAYNALADSWMAANPGRRITIYEIAGISCNAFLTMASPDKAINGFKVCGLWPLDPSVFKDDDFAGSLVTEEDHLSREEDQLPSLSAERSIITNFQPTLQPTLQPIVSESLPSFPSTEVTVSTQQPAHPLSETPAAFSVSSKESCPTSPKSASTISSKSDVIHTVGDGRCFFRSMVIGLNIHLQEAPRNESGLLQDPGLAVLETQKADELRTGAISYLKEHVEEYREFNEHVNADMPTRIQYSSIEQRIASMSNPNTFPGELEIVSTSRFLERTIIILTPDKRVISTYGENFSELIPLYLQFQSTGEDVGHYDYVSSVNKIATPRRNDSVSDTSNAEIRKLIRSFSPLPKITERRPRTKRAESATLLTSSPYKMGFFRKRHRNVNKLKKKQLN